MLGLLPFIFSCYTITNIADTYSSRNSLHTIVLNTDSTFNYFYNIEELKVNKYSCGKWSWIHRNKILLNSNVQSNIIPLDIEVIKSNNKNTIINVDLSVPGKDEKDYRCVPYVALIEDIWYEPNSLFIPNRGKYSYNSSNPINELFFNVVKEPRLIEFPSKEYYKLDTERKKITTNVGDIIHVKIEVPDSLFSYRLFDSEIIKIHGRKLIFKRNLLYRGIPFRNTTQD